MKIILVQSRKDVEGDAAEIARLISNALRSSRHIPAANFLATQRWGRRIVQEPFRKRWGVPGMFIATGAVFKGLAHELGFTFVAGRDTQDPGEDLRERLGHALNDEKHGFALVHTKVPDEAAHTGNPRAKVKMKSAKAAFI
jgi:2,3-bisphosphoglycerate-independent phosphoglycerate mutase